MVGAAEATDLSGYRRSNWRCLQQGLTQLLAVLAGCAIAFWFFLAIGYPSLPQALALVAFEAGLWLTYRAAAPAGRWAALLAVAIIGGAVLFFSASLPLPQGLMLLPLVVLGAGLALGPNAAPPAALLLGAALLRLDLDESTRAALNLSLGLAAALVWLGLRLWLAELEAAWNISALASELSREIQERQAELNRTMKTLQLTNHLLQSTNRELEVARREADEARQLKAGFAASVSHELRTPLSIILGFTELMTRTPEVYGDLPASPKLHRDIGEVRRAARYLSDLVDDILDLARADALRMPIHRESRQLREVIDDAVGTVRNLLEGRPVRLVAAVAADLPPLQIDYTRIRQVLLNLLTNAARFTAEGEIAVTAAVSGEEVLVSVSDTGVGVTAGDRERIFDEFFQLGAKQAAGGGKGLGLAVAKRIVQLHDGRIWCESEPGRGATFRFTLPVTPRGTSRLARGSEAGLPRDPYPASLVVVDPSPLAAAYVRRQTDGFAVHWAPDLERAGELALAHRPRALLLQGDRSAAEASEAAWPPGVPVISLPLPTERRLGEDERFSAYLTKPLSLPDLERLVQRRPGGDILVVDDDRGFVALMRRALESAAPGRRVHSAFDAEEALACLRRYRPGLVFLDIVMPGMDGFALADAIRAQAPEPAVRLVAVTGASLGEASAADGREFRVRLARGFRGEELRQLLLATLASVRPLYST